MGERGVLVVVALLVGGCGADLALARQASNATTATVTATSPLLHERCTVPALAAVAEVQAMPEGEARMAAARHAREALRSAKCVDLASAYEGAYDAAILLDAVVTNMETASCVGKSKAVDECNLAGAMAKAKKAAAALAATAKRVDR